jgi:hypothetical protein
MQAEEAQADKMSIAEWHWEVLAEEEMAVRPHLEITQLDMVQAEEEQVIQELFLEALEAAA